LGKHMPHGDRRLEAVIATHPDEDHIGGLVDVLREYEVATVVRTNMRSSSGAFGAFENSVGAKRVPITEGRKGLVLKFSGAALETLLPETSIPESFGSTNAGSIVLKLRSGDRTFLFMGDLPVGPEELIPDEKVSVLKVGHHGSKHSTGDRLLEKVRPDQAVVSVGAKNRYGHPASEVLQRLGSRGIPILRTDELGDIEYRCGRENCSVTGGVSVGNLR
jgi:competence protein ComEC